MTVNINIMDTDSVQNGVSDLMDYQQRLADRATEICRRLAEFGRPVAEVGFASVDYDGTKDVKVTVERVENGYAVKADGETVLFLEFGAGATYGYGHPRPEQYGPGTYPSDKGHWDDPDGWYWKHGERSKGNAPSEAMFNAERRITDEIVRIVNEVLQ